jgi:hypothetical protein
MVALRLLASLAGITGCLAQLSGGLTATTASVSGHTINSEFPKWQNCSCSSAQAVTQTATETTTVFLNYTTICAPATTVYLPMTDARENVPQVVTTSYITPSVSNGINGIFPFAVISGSTTWLRGAPPTNVAVVWDTPSTVTVEPTVVTNIDAIASAMSSIESNELVVVTSTATNFVTIAIPSAPLESAPGAETSSTDCADADVTCTLTITKTRHESRPTAVLVENMPSAVPTASTQDTVMSSPDSTTTILQTLTDTETRTITMTRKRKSSAQATVLATSMSIPSAAPSSSDVFSSPSSSEASPDSAESTTLSSLSGLALSSFAVFPPSSPSTEVSNSSATSELASAETTAGQVAPANSTTTNSTGPYPSAGTSTRNFYPNTTSNAVPTQGLAVNSTQVADNSTQVAADSLTTPPASGSAVLPLPMPPSNISIETVHYPKQYGAVRTTPVPASQSSTPDSDTASAPLASSLGSPASATPAAQINTTTHKTHETHTVPVHAMQYGSRGNSSSSTVVFITESQSVPSFSEFNTAAETATSAAPSTLHTAVRRAQLLV